MLLYFPHDNYAFVGVCFLTQLRLQRGSHCATGYTATRSVSYTDTVMIQHPPRRQMYPLSRSVPFRFSSHAVEPLDANVSFSQMFICMFCKRSLVEITEKADVIPSSSAGASRSINCPLAVCLCMSTTQYLIV